MGPVHKPADSALTITFLWIIQNNTVWFYKNEKNKATLVDVCKSAAQRGPVSPSRLADPVWLHTRVKVPVFIGMRRLHDEYLHQLTGESCNARQDETLQHLLATHLSREPSWQRGEVEGKNIINKLKHSHSIITWDLSQRGERKTRHQGRKSTTSFS